MYTKSTPACFVLSHSPTWAPKMLRSVDRDDSAHGDDEDELFTFPDLQLLVYFNFAIHDATVPVAARSKAFVCGRSLAGIAGSNHVGGMDVCFF